ncbi:urease accessory protein UreD [Corynebacterium urogenitale]
MQSSGAARDHVAGGLRGAGGQDRGAGGQDRPNRLDPAALTPPIPREVRRFVEADNARVTSGQKASGVLGVGKPGKVGVLELTLGAGESTGRTGLKERFVKAPMSLTRPLYVDPADDKHAVVYLRTTGGGLAENDRIRQRITLEAGADATVTTQAATNVHRMNAGLACQWTSFELGEGAHLEYLPGHTTLYGGARLVQLTEFDVLATASLIAGEITLAGRLARGEAHQFDALSLAMRVTRDGRSLLSDNFVVVGADSGRDLMLWGAYPVWGTLVAVLPQAGRGTQAAGSGETWVAAGFGDDRDLAGSDAGRGESWVAAGFGDARDAAGSAAGRGRLRGLDAEGSADTGGRIASAQELMEQCRNALVKACNGEQVGSASSDVAQADTALEGATQPDAALADVAFGVSTLVDGAGVVVRLAGRSTVGVRSAMTVVHDLLRQSLVGKSSFDLRRM